MFCGIHPEGTRKKDDDPYTFLPAQRGVGRIIQGARVPVIPVFINGLINDFPRQIESNFDGTGKEIHVMFGKPIDFGSLLDEPAGARTEQRIADRTLEVISELGQEEKQLRAARRR
jgi:1-acyl-sn-glycerol-3-phosphate acyltransferase